VRKPQLRHDHEKVGLDLPHQTNARIAEQNCKVTQNRRANRSDQSKTATKKS
jgi:hypothetical protein